MITRDHADTPISKRVEFDPVPARAAGQLAAAAASILAALGAASCCVVPLVLATIGVSGAWIANLTALAPYQPYFAALALTLVGGGFVLGYRGTRAACAAGSSCGRPASTRVAQIGLWTATGLLATALGFPYVAHLFVDF
jgi:mercuric ion transport protein